MWEIGNRVVSRFWTTGNPIGTVTAIEESREPYTPNAFSEAITPKVPVEWVTVTYDDGSIAEYMASDLRGMDRE